MKEGLYKLFQHVAGRQRREMDRESRLLFFYLDPFSDQLESCWPTSNVPELAQPSIHLIQNCLKRERSVVVHDAAVDPQIGGLEGADFKSAVCVPLFDPVGTVMGVIYADHPGVGVLGKDYRLEAERLARKLQPRIPKWTKLARRPEGGKKEDRSAISPGSLLISVVFLLIFLIAWLLAPSTPGEKSAARGEPTVSPSPSRPIDGLNTFLTLVSLREEAQAWSMLSAELREEIPQERFQQQLRRWMSDGRNRWDFDRRVSRTGSVSESKVEFFLDPVSELEDEKSWVVVFSLVDGSWKLSAARGGPIGYILEH